MSPSPCHRFLTKRRHVQPDLVNAGDQHAQVVADDLAKHLVYLSGIGLAPQAVTELGLDEKPRVCPKCKSPYWDRPRQLPKEAG